MHNRIKIQFFTYLLYHYAVMLLVKSPTKIYLDLTNFGLFFLSTRWASEQHMFENIASVYPFPGSI